MSTSYEPRIVFPSTASLEIPLSRRRDIPGGDTFRAGLARCPVISRGVLVPSASGLERMFNIKAPGLEVLAGRANERTIQGLLAVATGLPVTKHIGYVIDLGALQPEEALPPDPVLHDLSHDAASPTQVAETLARTRDPEELLALASALADIATNRLTQGANPANNVE